LEHSTGLGVEGLAAESFKGVPASFLDALGV